MFPWRTLTFVDTFMVRVARGDRAFATLSAPISHMVDSDADDLIMVEACREIEQAQLTAGAAVPVDANCHMYGEDKMNAIRLAEKQLNTTTGIASHSVVGGACEVRQAQLTARAAAPVDAHYHIYSADEMRAVKLAEKQLNAMTAANASASLISQAHLSADGMGAIKLAKQQLNATTEPTSHNFAANALELGQAQLTAPGVAPVDAHSYVYSDDEMSAVRLAEKQLKATTTASGSASLMSQPPQKRSRTCPDEDMDVELELQSELRHQEDEAERIMQQEMYDYDSVIAQFEEHNDVVEIKSAPPKAKDAMGVAAGATLPAQPVVHTPVKRAPVTVTAVAHEPVVQTPVAAPAVAHEAVVQTPVAVPAVASAEFEYTLKKKGVSNVIETSRVMKDVGLIVPAHQNITPALYGNVRVHNQLVPLLIPADVMTAWTTPNLYDVLNAIPNQELVAEFYHTVPTTVQRVALEAITISPTLMQIQPRTEYIREITKYWRSIHFEVSLKFREMAPLILFTWVVIEGFAGVGTALLCLNCAMKLILKRYPHVNIKVAKVLSYEIEQDALFIHRNAVSPFIEREWLCTIEHNGDIANALEDVVAKVPKYQEGQHIIMVAGTPCDDTSLANEKTISAGKSCLHGSKSCNFFQWHKCCVRATRSYPRGSVVVVDELPKMKVNSDEHEATGYMGAAAYSNSKNWNMGSRQRFWRCSPPVLDSLVTSPAAGQFRPLWVQQTQELNRTLIDGSRWHPQIPLQKPKEQAERVEVSVIRRFWPVIVTKCRRGELLSEYELMTVRNMKVCKNSTLYHAGVAFFVDYMGCKGTPLQDIPAFFKCDERISHKTKEKSESRDPSVANECGITEFCNNCARAMRVLGGAFELNQSTEVFCRVLNKAMQHWLKKEDHGAFFEFNKIPHDCGAGCPLRP